MPESLKTATLADLQPDEENTNLGADHGTWVLQESLVLYDVGCGVLTVLPDEGSAFPDTCPATTFRVFGGARFEGGVCALRVPARTGAIHHDGAGAVFPEPRKGTRVLRHILGREYKRVAVRCHIGRRCECNKSYKTELDAGLAAQGEARGGKERLRRATLQPI